MSLNSLSFRDLEYLLATARHLHFGKAAQECNVSQPALSTQIKKIESQLGVNIFERTNRKVFVTEMGRKIIDQTRKIMDQIKLLDQLAKDTSKLLESTLKLGTIASLGPYLLPYLLPKVKKSFSNLKLLLQEGLTTDLVFQLRKGLLDVVIAAPTFDDAGLDKYPLFWEPFILTLPKGHDLGKRKLLSAKDLRSEDMVLLSDGHCLKDQTLSFCSIGKGKTLQQFQATGLETLKQLVAVGAGYTVLPLLAVETSGKMNSLLDYRTLEKKMGREIYLYCRSAHPQAQEMKLLVNFIRENIPASLTCLN